MIRVNLLPEAIKPKTPKGPKRPRPEIPVTWIIIGLVVVLITCVGLGLYHLSLQKQADTLQSEIVRYQNEIKKLKVDVQKVDRVKSQRNELNNKLAIIDKLKSAQKGPVHLLDQIASCIPPRVWLKTVSENGESMSIQGQALEHISISKFMQSLEKSPFFENVELSNATTEGARKGGEDVKSFSLTCNIRIPKEYL
jgi:type IV pilus assembly protein PilN